MNQLEINIRFYITEAGRSPVTEWLKALDGNMRASAQARLARVRSGNLGDVRPIKGGISELRLHGPGHRIYFARLGDAVILLLCAGDKGSQRRDIAAAKRYYQDYSERNDG